ncbi:MAG: glycosyltransferase family 4 protein [Planctomycetota bacterium]
MTAPRWPITVAMVGGKGLPATFGGVERVIEEVGARLVARGHRVIVTSRDSYAGSHTGATHRGMEIVRAPWHLRRKGFDSLSASATGALRVLLASRWRPDVMHLHGLGVAPLAMFARWCGVRTVAQVHGIEWRNAQWSWPVRRYFRWCEWPLVRWTDAVASGGHFDAEGLQARHRGAQVVALPNGVTIPTETGLMHWRAAHGRGDFASFAAGRFLLYVGRLVPEKGPQHLLRAFVQAATDGRIPVDVQLVVVGGSPGRDAFVQQLHQLVPDALRPRVNFTGFRYEAELLWLWTHAALFVLPSESEGLALTLLEAMAHRTPTLVSDIRQNTDVTAGLVPQFRAHDVDALAAALASALACPPSRLALDAAREHVAAHYSWDRVVDQVEQLYRRVLGA